MINRIKTYLLAVLLFISFQSCFLSEKQLKKSAFISVDFHLYNGSMQFKQSHRIWYKDGFAIKEVKITNFKTDTAGVQTINERLQYYLFADIKKNLFYEYNTLSDTASMVKKYFEFDTLNTSHASELYFKKNIDFLDIPEHLTDTVINNVVYQRIKFKRINGKNKYISIGFFQCDRDSIFRLLNYQDLRCPMVKLFDYSQEYLDPIMSLEINLISDKLSEEMLKVFDAWEKNAEKYPVNK
jgi:hypothetical protein